MRGLTVGGFLFMNLNRPSMHCIVVWVAKEGVIKMRSLVQGIQHGYSKRYPVIIREDVASLGYGTYGLRKMSMRIGLGVSSTARTIFMIRWDA